METICKVCGQGLWFEGDDLPKDAACPHCGEPLSTASLEASEGTPRICHAEAGRTAIIADAEQSRSAGEQGAAQISNCTCAMCESPISGVPVVSEKSLATDQMLGYECEVCKRPLCPTCKEKHLKFSWRSGISEAKCPKCGNAFGSGRRFHATDWQYEVPAGDIARAVALMEEKQLTSKDAAARLLDEREKTDGAPERRAARLKRLEAMIDRAMTEKEAARDSGPVYRRFLNPLFAVLLLPALALSSLFLPREHRFRKSYFAFIDQASYGIVVAIMIVASSIGVWKESGWGVFGKLVFTLVGAPILGAIMASVSTSLKLWTIGASVMITTACVTSPSSIPYIALGVLGFIASVFLLNVVGYSLPRLFGADAFTHDTEDQGVSTAPNAVDKSSQQDKSSVRAGARR